MRGNLDWSSCSRLRRSSRRARWNFAFCCFSCFHCAHAPARERTAGPRRVRGARQAGVRDRRRSVCTRYLFEIGPRQTARSIGGRLESMHRLLPLVLDGLDLCGDLVLGYRHAGPRGAAEVNVCVPRSPAPGLHAPTPRPRRVPWEPGHGAHDHTHLAWFSCSWLLWFSWPGRSSDPVPDGLFSAFVDSFSNISWSEFLMVPADQP